MIKIRIATNPGCFFHIGSFFFHLLEALMNGMVQFLYQNRRQICKKNRPGAHLEIGRLDRNNSKGDLMCWIA